VNHNKVIMELRTITSVMPICSVDRVRAIQCRVQLTAARFRHQLYLNNIAASQVGVHRRLGRVPDSKM